MTYRFKISVRTLVEYVLRSGSIESGFRTATTLTDGTKAHQKIQKTYKETDQKEVYVTTEIPYEDLTFVVDGRCDGLLFNENGQVTVDEIKSTRNPVEWISEDTYPVHWAQAIFYAFIYAKDHDLAEITIQLTYVQVNTEQQVKFKREMNFQELKTYVNNIVGQYAVYAKVKLQHVERRDVYARELLFPFESYRDGQRKLAASVYKTIFDKKDIFASASTGIGKTVSTIFPAVKAIGEGHLQRMFYLTAKTITRTAAEEAFRLLEEKGSDLKVVTITAKDKICFQEEVKCSKEHCIFAEGFYDRINEAVLDIYANETLMSRQVIETYARKHRVCPFEFSLELAYIADAVICDYNYIFDPKVSLKRLFEEQKKETVLLVDEAHNLVDRAREMYSADLYKSAFLQLSRTFKNRNESLAKSAKAINNYLLSLKKQENLISKDLDDELVALTETFSMHAETELVQHMDTDSLLLDTYFATQSFVKIAKLYDERFVTYMEILKSDVRLKLFCLDPSYLINKMGKGYRSKIFFSATLTPADYYKTLLGGTEKDYVTAIPSPFDREKAEVIILPMSTRYRDRERTMTPIVQFVENLITKQSGNFLVFFPSYHYMEAVHDAFQQFAPHVKTIVQTVGMSETDREEFLAAFMPDTEEKLIGFAVLGGIFSEGVDLKGERLQGVIIVGVGLPQIGLERDIIKDYFNSIGRNGYDYAYVFPGMNKVLQAGGRLIRSESDQGTIALIDDRFLQRKYQALFPFEWQHFRIER